jgi:hypothetical protein
MPYCDGSSRDRRWNDLIWSFDGARGRKVLLDDTGDRTFFSSQDYSSSSTYSEYGKDASQKRAPKNVALLEEDQYTRELYTG